MRLNTPFFSNTIDDLHCYQAALKMALKYFYPKRNFSWSQLDKLSARKEGKWTWPFVGVQSLNKLSLKAKMFWDFDVKQFSERGREYLKEVMSQEDFEAQDKHSDLEYEIVVLKKYCKDWKNIFVKRTLSFEDIKKFHDRGYFIICWVNYNAIWGKPGTVGHFVVITEFSDNSVTIHDPGLPPRPSWSISKEAFEKAQGYVEVIVISK